ncbi:hypothetical protein FRC02_003259 [Tulasnella sp. 418]|nr:hypothetical protein FRC02_003259 [Tulasnella sp. 418]
MGRQPYFEELLTIIRNALSSSSRDVEQNLYYHLEQARPKFLKLFDVPPRNPQEKRDIETGTAKVNGKSSIYNEQFKQEALFLAQELDCSELFCAELLDDVSSLETMGRTATAEKAVERFHLERMALLSCLRQILEAALNPTRAPNRLTTMLQNYVAELISMAYDLGNGRGQGRLAEKILLEIGNLKTSIEKQRVSLLSAPTRASTFATPGTQVAKFNETTIKFRIDALEHERRQLGHLLYIFAASRELAPSVIIKMVRWLSSSDRNENIIFYIFIAVLATLDPSPDVEESDEPNSLLSDREFIVPMHSLMEQTPWKVPELKAAANLQWSLCVLESRRQDPHLQGNLRGVEEDVEKIADNGIKGDAFKYLMSIILLSRSSDVDIDDEVGGTEMARQSEAVQLVDPDFRPYLLTQIDTLIHSFIVNMSSLLRKVRHREDDTSFAITRKSVQASPSHDPPQQPRDDIESLFMLVAVLYTEREPESGYKFWRGDEDDGRLYSFLRWATEAKRPEVIVAVYEMLASLARGPLCAMETFNFLASGGGQYLPNQAQAASCSWNTLFNTLHYYANLMTNIRSRPSTTSIDRTSGMRATVGPASTLPPEEVALLRPFLRLLRNVIRWSLPARDAIRDHQDFQAIPILSQLLGHPVPLELKASLYDTLAAFCGPDGGIKGAETIRHMWNYLERSDILPVRDVGPGLPRIAGGMGVGAVVELEQVETPAKQYPATTSLINLLNSLILTPSNKLTVEQGAEVDTQTIPDNLGAGYRTPGIQPYVQFVVENVILPAGSREYITQMERFRLIDGCFTFLEKCLASYDLAVLETADASFKQGNAIGSGLANIIVSLVIHPGFDVLRRLLVNESPLRNQLFTFINEGYNAIENNLAQTHYFNRSVRRALKIVYRVLRTQGLFINGLLPFLSENPDLPGLGRVNVPHGILPLDQYLLWSPELVPQIGLYVNRTEDSEMMLLAINILASVSESPIFNVVDSMVPGASKKMNRLVVLLDRHEHTPAIVAGFVRLLDMDANLQEETPDGAISIDDIPDPSSSSADLSHALRQSIMTLLLKNTAPGSSAPNIAHLLLGFSIRSAPSDMMVADPRAAGTQISCLHTALALLNVGVPRWDEDGQEVDDGSIPLFLRNPLFAEECYRLVHQLSVHEFTSQATTRYLRNREDFFARQLAVLPVRSPPTQEPSAGHILYEDQVQVRTSCASFTAFLRLRSWLMESVALELHMLSDRKQVQRISRLLDLIFDTAEDQPMHTDDALFGAPRSDQPLIRILEIFHSLDFEWKDSINPAPMSLQFYSVSELQSCQRVNEHGCQVFDVAAIMSLISNTRKRLQRQGALGSDLLLKQLKLETQFILESCVVENNVRSVEHARHLSIEAWRHVLDISLTKCFDRIPRERRESITLDILQAIPPFLAKWTTAVSTSVTLAESMLSLMTKLREDRHHQLIVQSTVDDAFAASLPIDRLHSILRSIVEYLLKAGTAERVRGNLYATIINHLHLVLSPEERSNASSYGYDGVKNLSRSTFTMFDDPVGDDLFMSVSGNLNRNKVKQRSALERGTLNIIDLFVERLIPVISRDATDGSEVWRTVSFTLLDAMVQLSRVEKAHKVLNVMAREGFLKNFVHGIKSAEKDMAMVLKPDPDNLNSLYVYEAKMSMLIRVAQTRQGAERLLDCRVFSILAQCDFIGARPQNDQAFLDYDSFLPSAIERHHQILIPALQLAVSVLSTVGALPVVSKQALDFVLSHRATFLHLLNDNSSTTSLAILRELNLLVALCSFILPSVDELYNASSYGAIHSSILSLAARCTNRRRWKVKLGPANDTEQEEASRAAIGYGKDTSVWVEKVDTTILALQKWVAVYSINVTDVDNNFKPVIAPITTLTADGESTSNVNSPMPTITDTIMALRTSVQSLTTVLGQIQDISTKLSRTQEIDVQEVQQICKTSGIEFLDELDLAHQRILASGELCKAWERYRQHALDRLHHVEMLLLLLWKHINFFLTTFSSRSSLMGSKTKLSFGPTDMSHSIRPVTSTSQQNAGGIDASVLREQSAQGIIPVLEQLEETDLPREVIGQDSHSRRSYIELLSRRLRDILSPNVDL